MLLKLESHITIPNLMPTLIDSVGSNPVNNEISTVPVLPHRVALARRVGFRRWASTTLTTKHAMLKSYKMKNSIQVKMNRQVNVLDVGAVSVVTLVIPPRRWGRKRKLRVMLCRPIKWHGEWNSPLNKVSPTLNSWSRTLSR